MATIETPTPAPRQMSVAERQGTATAEAKQYPLPVLRVFQGAWVLWLIACLFLFIPYLAGLFGGTAFLFANLGNVIFGGFSGIFGGLSRLVMDIFILPPWLGLSAETETFIIDGWLSPLLIILGLVLIQVLWTVSKPLPTIFRVLVRIPAVFIGFVVALQILILLSYPLGFVSDLFVRQEKWYAIPITIVGAALVYFLWKWIDTLPVAFHGIGRFLTAILATIVALEFLVVLSYPLDWLRGVAANAIANIPADFMNNVLKSWWLPLLVIIVGSILIWLLWTPARLLAGIALAGLLLWAHMFGWQVSQINPQVLVEKAPKTKEIFTGIFQPDIFGRDDQVIELQSQSVIGVETPPETTKPVTIEQQLTSILASKRPHEAGEEVVPPKDESETLNLKVNISSDTVAPGQTITVTGSGFKPSVPGTIRWQSTGLAASVEDIGTFNADAQGNFVTPIKVPDDPERIINLSGTPNTIAFRQTWPTGDLYFTDTFNLLRNAIIETIFIALMGTTIGVILALPLSFLAAANLMSHNVVSKTIYVATRTLLNLMRAMEVLIWALIFVAAVGLGPFAGMLALALHSIASLGKLYSEAIEAIDPGPIEAITATGANRLQVIRYAVVPQFIPQFVSFTLYRWDINVRMATIIGLVGGGGIGLLLIQYMNLLDWRAAGTAMLLIAIVVIAMDYVSSRIRAAVV